MTGASIICVGLVHVYRAAGTDVAALRGVDMSIGAGERVALLGPSGSGKSTLIAIIAGIRRPSAGAVIVGGVDISRLPDRQMRAYRGHTVGTLLQGSSANLLGYASPLENLAHAQRVADPRPAAGDAATLLRSVGLDTRHQHIPVRRLSPSGQQATALAVALHGAPRVLVADEPTSQLDPSARDRLLDVMLSLAAERGTTVLIVTHDSAVAVRMDRTLHLRDGRIGAEGRGSERLAVLGVDGSLHLPDDLRARWPGGTLVRVRGVSPNELQITRVEDS